MSRARFCDRFGNVAAQVFDGRRVLTQDLKRSVLPRSLTLDHRAVTGGEAARFLKAVVHDVNLGD